MQVPGHATNAFSSALLILAVTSGASAQSIPEAKQQADTRRVMPAPNPFRNDRLKRSEGKDSPIKSFHDTRVIVDGMWVPESKDPAREIVLPEQVEIICTHSEMTCEEMKVTLGPTAGVVFIDSIGQTVWTVTSWDGHGLLASYGPEVSALAASDRCHRHVLAMTFSSGAISTSDIPTHEKGCEMFAETDSYRLIRGFYYIDTSPGNDQDRQYKDRPAK